MKQVTAREANQQFAKILTAVEAGEEVMISKYGKPVAVMSPYRPALDAEHQTAVSEFLAVLNEPLIPAKDFRMVSRDDMHERP
jgi:prevent-host-death family protein